MDYKKLYEKAVERAKTLTNSGFNDFDFVKHIFPELKESEDEKIRKGIIRNLGYLMDRAEGFVKDELKERIAWLEKQGEQKPTDVRTIGYWHVEDVEQKPAAWSEEDDQYLLVCKNALAKYQISDKWDAGIISHWLENKLKYLKERYTWKPSDEQMKALADALSLAKNCGEETAFDLRTLYEQLKKLTK